VNLGSDADRVGSLGQAAYSAAKGGVIAFTKSRAREMVPSTPSRNTAFVLGITLGGIKSLSISEARLAADLHSLQTLLPW
jgi:NAD(P)-dependent dehydrogenase (short-subunit alcohol dehydrogenase family)